MELFVAYKLDKDLKPIYDKILGIFDTKQKAADNIKLVYGLDNDIWITSIIKFQLNEIR